MILVQFSQCFERNALLNRAEFEKSMILVQFSQRFEKNSLLNRAKIEKSMILVQFSQHFANNSLLNHVKSILWYLQRHGIKVLNNFAGMEWVFTGRRSDIVIT